MAYFDAARLCKHAQAYQLSMDEQLAAVVLTTLSCRPAASSLSATGPSSSGPQHRRISSIDRSEGELRRPKAVSDGGSITKSQLGLQTKRSQSAAGDANASTVRSTHAWKRCGGAATVLRHGLDDELAKERSRENVSGSGFPEDVYYHDVGTAPGTGNAGVTVPPSTCDLSEVFSSNACESILFDHDYQKKACRGGVSDSDCYMLLKKGVPSNSYPGEALRTADCNRQGQDQASGSCWRRAPAREPPADCAGRRKKHDVKKCRKVYGVTNRRLWCTQCRWKKACSRFMFRS